MKILCEGKTLNISDLEELSLANSDCFGREMRAALGDGVKDIVIDLSSTSFMDCTGLGALAALSKTAREFNDGISVHLLNPTPVVQRIATLARLDGLFQNSQKCA
jgi:anti-sigma B factor antagonist